MRTARPKVWTDDVAEARKETYSYTHTNTLAESIIGKFLSFSFEMKRELDGSFPLLPFDLGECTTVSPFGFMKNGWSCLLVLFRCGKHKVFESVERKIIKTIYFLAIWCNLLLFVVIIDLGDDFFLSALIPLAIPFPSYMSQTFSRKRKLLFVCVCVCAAITNIWNNVSSLHFMQPFYRIFKSPNDFAFNPMQQHKNRSDDLNSMRPHRMYTIAHPRIENHSNIIIVLIEIRVIQFS